MFSHLRSASEAMPDHFRGGSPHEEKRMSYYHLWIFGVGMFGFAAVLYFLANRK